MIVRAQIISGVKLPLELFNEAKNALMKTKTERIPAEVINEIRKELALAQPAARALPQREGLDSLIRHIGWPKGMGPHPS